MIPVWGFSGDFKGGHMEGGETLPATNTIKRTDSRRGAPSKPLKIHWSDFNACLDQPVTVTSEYFLSLKFNLLSDELRQPGEQ